MNQNNDQPQFKTDAKGNNIRVENIKPMDLARDEFVLEMVEKAKEHVETLSKFRANSLADIEAFIHLAAEEYGVKLGRIKGNVQLMSFDGKYKILRAISDTITFDEKLQAAKVLIDECLHEWTEDSRPEIQTIINNAFSVDKQGNLSTSKILSLLRLNIEHEKWKRAMVILRDSIIVQCSKAYIRIYERNDAGEYVQLNLNIARA